MTQDLKEQELEIQTVPETVGETAAEGENEEAENAETRRLREENERLREEIERVKNLPMKERLYDHVHVSLKTMDIFIITMIVLGIIAVVVGMLK